MSQKDSKIFKRLTRMPVTLVGLKNFLRILRSLKRFRKDSKTETLQGRLEGSRKDCKNFWQLFSISGSLQSF